MRLSFKYRLYPTRKQIEALEHQLREACDLFLSKLSYKAANAGRTFVKVNPRGTSQTCICGASVAKKLRDRWHDCPECGLSAGRDHVSAQVILQRARTEPSCANVGVVKPALHEKPSRNRRSGHEKNGWATQQAKD